MKTVKINLSPKRTWPLLIQFLITIVTIGINAADWRIPVVGNVFMSAPVPGNQGISRRGTLSWSNPENVYSLYFHIDRPAQLKLGLLAQNSEGSANIEIRIAKEAIPIELAESSKSPLPIGLIQTEQAGYVRVDIQGRHRTGTNYGKLDQLTVSSDTPELQLDFVRNNKGNMFYWGRRGPSVHLRYSVPEDRPIRYAYTEVTVPHGADPIGSFYMANGFGEGYFGFQVNASDERRVLFSVWSPFKTDNPEDIPEDQRITPLAKGIGVRIGKFGNEGSGGQSYLIYPWEAGLTYRFLTRVEPDGKGRTVYTSWFGEKASDTWRLIASFSRPKTDTDLNGFHSFLESFSPSYGHIGRRAHYGNVWVRDTREEWHECTQARFSVDATGRGRHRLDYKGGIEDSGFYLQNCGFFSDTAKPGTVFERSPTDNGPPAIDFKTLPQGESPQPQTKETGTRRL